MQANMCKDIFNYLYLNEPPRKADLVIGFGHFDTRVPARCLELHEQGLAPLILFTGGVGAGSTGLNKPEAEVFLEEAKRLQPRLEESKVMLENQSTNTGENIRFSIKKMQENGYWPPGGFQKILLVATPYRQRRVFRTCRLFFSGTELVNCPPASHYEKDSRLYASKGEDLDQLLLGEMKRLRDYPAKGFMEKENIPPHLLEFV
jgi:uncharacterized SAM-binding protein YcdF (DUF218 family)